MGNLNINQKHYRLTNANTEKEEVISVPCAGLIDLNSRQDNFENSVKGIYHNVKETKTDIISKIDLVNNNVNQSLELQKEIQNKVLQKAIIEITNVVNNNTKNLENIVNSFADGVESNTKSIRVLTEENTKRQIRRSIMYGGFLVLSFASGYVIPKVISFLWKIITN